MDVLLQGLRAAAEPTRLRLLALCAHAELTVTDLTQILAQSQPRVSRHLKLLCEAGLLTRHQEGTWALYRLSQDAGGGELARTLVDLVPENDPVLARDLVRLEEIMERRAKQAADYFRDNAEFWNEIRSLHVPAEKVERALLQLVGDGVIANHLDIGTATGRVLEIFADRTERSVGIDISREMLNLARANLERGGRRHCQVRLGDMYNLTTTPGKYDLITFHMVLHYAERPEAAIAEAARMLRPGGQMLIVDFASHRMESLREEHRHHWLGFQETDVSNWCLNAGLEAELAQSFEGDPLTVLIWRARRPVHAAESALESAREKS